MALSSPSDDNMYESEKDDAFTSNVSSPMSDGPVPGIDSPEGETPEEKERRMAELKEELDKVESEINMLRQVLGSKVRHATELKRKLGITPFQEFKSDISSGLQQIKSSDSYQKTSAVMKTAGDKTTSALGAVGSVMSKKMGEIKNSSTFKSFDERVHTTYASVKAKVTGSRSSQDIDEAFRDAQIAEDGVVEAGATEGSGEGDEKKVPL